MPRLWQLLLPELRRFPARDQEPAFEKARQTDLDLVELAGVVLALVLVAALTRYGLADRSFVSRFAMGLMNLIVALPMIALLVTPLHIRRLRRGLRAQLRLLD